MNRLLFLLTILSFFFTRQAYCKDCPVAEHCVPNSYDRVCACTVEINETECIKLEMDEKIKCLEDKAKKGDTEAMFFLGAIYKYDFGNEEKAIEWFKKVGDSRSFFEIGGIHCDRVSREWNNRFINPQYTPIYNAKNELIINNENIELTLKNDSLMRKPELIRLINKYQ